MVLGWPLYGLRRLLWLLVYLGVQACLIAIVYMRLPMNPLPSLPEDLRQAILVAGSIVASVAYFALVLRAHRAAGEVPPGHLPCPRCGHPMENLDLDTVMCMECGVKAEYRAVKRAWRRVGPLHRPKRN